jgi:hypothetical protein
VVDVKQRAHMQSVSYVSTWSMVLLDFVSVSGLEKDLSLLHVQRKYLSATTE